MIAGEDWSENVPKSGEICNLRQRAFPYSSLQGCLDEIFGAKVKIFFYRTTVQYEYAVAVLAEYTGLFWIVPHVFQHQTVQKVCETKRIVF